MSYTYCSFREYIKTVWSVYHGNDVFLRYFKKKKKSFCIFNDYIYVDNNCIPCGPYINYTIRELEMCGQSEIHRLMLVTC